MFVKGYPNLGKSLPQKAGIKSCIVGNNRVIPNKAANLPRQRGKILRLIQFLLGDSRKAFDKGPQLHSRGLYQVIHRIGHLTIFKAHQGHLDDFVLIKFQSCGFQVHGNKIRNTHLHLTPSKAQANWESTCSIRFHL